MTQRRDEERPLGTNFEQKMTNTDHKRYKYRPMTNTGHKREKYRKEKGQIPTTKDTNTNHKRDKYKPQKEHILTKKGFLNLQVRAALGRFLRTSCIKVDPCSICLQACFHSPTDESVWDQNRNTMNRNGCLKIKHFSKTPIQELRT